MGTTKPYRCGLAHLGLQLDPIPQSLRCRHPRTRRADSETFGGSRTRASSWAVYQSHSYIAASIVRAYSASPLRCSACPRADTPI